MKRIQGPLITFEINGIEILNPTVSECGRFPVSPEHYGFEIWSTGGGCTAWGKILPNGEQLLLTDAGGMDHFLTEKQLAIYGHYGAGGQTLAQWEFTVGVAVSREEIEGEEGAQ
jgi:hypothetical protein